MTDDLHLKLAEKLGWTEIQNSLNSGASGKSLWTCGSSLHGVIPGDAGKHEDDQSFIPLPDLSSLVRTAEQGLTKEHKGLYASKLLCARFPRISHINQLEFEHISELITAYHEPERCATALLEVL